MSLKTAHWSGHLDRPLDKKVRVKGGHQSGKDSPMLKLI